MVPKGSDWAFSLQTVNVIFMFLPNAYIINHCRYFGPFIDVCAYIRWTCWNLVSHFLDSSSSQSLLSWLL